MKTILLKSIALLATVLFVVACSRDVSYNEALNKNKKLDDPNLVSDANFLVEASSITMLEEELARLATDTAYAADVVKLSKQNIADYELLEEDLNKLAQKKKIKLPTEISTEHQRMYNEVSSADQKDFDKDLIRTLEKVNEENKDEFEQMATEAHDADIRAFSARYLAMLRTHSERLKEAEKHLLDTY